MLELGKGKGQATEEKHEKFPEATTVKVNYGRWPSGLVIVIRRFSCLSQCPIVKASKRAF